MRIVLIGADGQLAYDLKRTLCNEDLIPLTHGEIEVKDIEVTQKRLSSLSPEVIINTAAYHKVDECEKNPYESFAVNSVGALNIARASKDLNAVCVFLSTDYVFDGNKSAAYTEEDTPNPINVYGVSKLSGESLVRFTCPKYFIVRTSGLFGIAGSRKGWNFVELMIKLAHEREEIKVVNDQILTPTYTLDLANKITELIHTENYGTYHITNSGCCSWYDFAKAIFEISGVKVKLTPVTSEVFKTAAKRPKYSVLEHTNLRKIGKDNLRTWQEALTAYLKEKEVIK